MPLIGIEGLEGCSQWNLYGDAHQEQGSGAAGLLHQWQDRGSARRRQNGRRQACGDQRQRHGRVLSFDRAAVLSNLLVDIGLFPAHAARRPLLASAKPDLLISRLRQPIHIAADLHVRLEGPAVQLIPEMLAQRRLANLKLSSYLAHRTSVLSIISTPSLWGHLTSKGEEEDFPPP
jgi:hypothetical protein